MQAAESQKLTRQAGSAVRGSLDLFNLSRIFLGRRQYIPEKFGVPFDDHQKIVEIVRHAACQPAHCLHFLGLPELLFEEVPFADVLRDDEADSLA